MKDNNLEQMKKEYMNVPIPRELDFIVKNTLKESGLNNMSKKNSIRRVCTIAASITAVAVILTVSANSSPVFAKTLSEVPIVGNIIKVLTFKEYKVNEDTYKANIKAPAIQGLENKKLENSLNEKYLTESKKLYDQFIADTKDLEKNGGGHMGVDSGYIVKTDNEVILSIGRYVVSTVGSSSTTIKYDTVDKKKQVLLTLPGLFKDDSYIAAISENIKKQMREQYKADNSKFYWVKGVDDSGTFGCFEKIMNEQGFYINSEGKLVICFDKYEIAPGYMGTPEFVIPTGAISNILVGNEYIK